MIRTLTLLLAPFALGPLLACSASHNTGTDSGAPPDTGVADGSGSDSSRADSGRLDSGVADSARPDVGPCADPPAGNSRPVAWECSDCRPPGSGVASGGECAADVDCAAGENGRCVAARFGGMCSYDGCFSDGDCAPDELCACDGGFGGGNACIQAGCHVDSECFGYDCSPTLGSCGDFFPPIGYFCHAAGDACFSDADCTPGYCAYDPTTSVWACSTSGCDG